MCFYCSTSQLGLSKNLLPFNAKWVRRLDSNQRLQAYEACYLTTDLLRIFGANGGTWTLTAVNRRILSSLCLPVPPHSHIGAPEETWTLTLLSNDFWGRHVCQFHHRSILWYPRRDLNSHDFRHMILSHACLPISPRGHGGSGGIRTHAGYHCPLSVFKTDLLSRLSTLPFCRISFTTMATKWLLIAIAT